MELCLSWLPEFFFIHGSVQTAAIVLLSCLWKRLPVLTRALKNISRMYWWIIPPLYCCRLSVWDAAVSRELPAVLFVWCPLTYSQEHRKLLQQLSLHRILGTFFCSQLQNKEGEASLNWPKLSRILTAFFVSFQLHHLRVCTLGQLPTS